MVYRPDTLKNKRGFTLIELTVVIILLGILAGIISPSFINALRRGRDSRRRQNLTKLRTALRAYYNDHQAYPLSSSGSIMDGTDVYAWGTDFIVNGIEYMAPLPLESREPQYFYSRTDDETYSLEACLEHPEDDDPLCVSLESTCPSTQCFIVTQ